MVDSEQQPLQHGQTAKTSPEAYRHECTLGRDASYAVVIIHAAESQVGNHCAVTKHGVGVAGVIRIGHGDIVATVPHIVWVYDCSGRKLGVRQVEIAVDNRHYHLVAALGEVPGIIGLDSVEMPRLGRIANVGVRGPVAHIHHALLEYQEGYVGDLPGQLGNKLATTLRWHLYRHQLGIYVAEEYLVLVAGIEFLETLGPTVYIAFADFGLEKHVQTI